MSVIGFNVKNINGVEIIEGKEYGLIPKEISELKDINGIWVPYVDTSSAIGLGENNVDENGSIIIPKDRKGILIAGVIRLENGITHFIFVPLGKEASYSELYNNPDLIKQALRDGLSLLKKVAEADASYNEPVEALEKFVQAIRD